MRMRGWGILLLMLGAVPAAQADISISNKPTQNMSCSAGVCTATARDAVLNVGDLQTMLAGGDAAVKTGYAARNIDVTSPLSWSSTSRLTLDARRSVVLRKRINARMPEGSLSPQKTIEDLWCSAAQLKSAFAS